MKPSRSITQIDLQHGPAWQAAKNFGCDMDLLEESLALPPAERLRLHTIALRRIEQLEAAMKRVSGESRSSGLIVSLREAWIS